MIKNSWQNTTLKCDNCGQGTFVLNNSLNYECPICKNKINYTAFEKVLDKLSELESEKFINSEVGSLVGESFYLSKKIHCKVEEDNGNGSFVIKIKQIK